MPPSSSLTLVLKSLLSIHGLLSEAEEKQRAKSKHELKEYISSVGTQPAAVSSLRQAGCRRLACRAGRSSQALLALCSYPNQQLAFPWLVRVPVHSHGTGAGAGAGAGAGRGRAPLTARDAEG